MAKAVELQVKQLLLLITHSQKTILTWAVVRKKHVKVLHIEPRTSQESKKSSVESIGDQGPAALTVSNREYAAKSPSSVRRVSSHASPRAQSHDNPMNQQTLEGY